MKIEELKSLVDKHTAEDGVNYDELNKAINAKFDGLIESKVSKAKETGKGENIEAFIKDQGFENIDQFTAFVKNSKATSTELTEKVTRYETELDALKGENGKLKVENDNYAYLGKLSNVKEDMREFALYKIKGLMDDGTDFDTAKDKYLTDNVHYLADNDTKIVTKLPKGGEHRTQPDGVVAALERKHGIKLE